MISLKQAEDIRENFSPAFAGYVTDGDISRRDVLATLMDLIIKGYVELDANTQQTPQKIKKISLTGKSETWLLAFEKEFLEVLFKDKRELSNSEVRGALHEGMLEEIILDNISTLRESKIVRAGIVFFDKKGNEVWDPFWSRLAKEVKTVGELDDRYRMLKIDAETNKFDLHPVSFVSYMDAKSKVDAYEKLDAFMDFQFSQTIIPEVKEKFALLFEFLQAHPLKNQRLHNEFMPFAVAFGLDTSWNRSFGIPTERIADPRKSIIRDPKRVCKECGGILLKDESKCTVCGLETDEVKEKKGEIFDWEYECDKCGGRVAKTKKICSECGDPITKGDTPLVFKI